MTVTDTVQRSESTLDEGLETRTHRCSRTQQSAHNYFVNAFASFTCIVFCYAPARAPDFSSTVFGQVQIVEPFKMHSL